MDGWLDGGYFRYHFAMHHHHNRPPQPSSSSSYRHSSVSHCDSFPLWFVTPLPACLPHPPHHPHSSSICSSLVVLFCCCCCLKACLNTLCARYIHALYASSSPLLIYLADKMRRKTCFIVHSPCHFLPSLYPSHSISFLSFHPPLYRRSFSTSSLYCFFCRGVSRFHPISTRPPFTTKSSSSSSVAILHPFVSSSSSQVGINGSLSLRRPPFQFQSQIQMHWPETRM